MICSCRIINSSLIKAFILLLPVAVIAILIIWLIYRFTGRKNQDNMPSSRTNKGFRPLSFFRIGPCMTWPVCNRRPRLNSCRSAGSARWNYASTVTWWLPWWHSICAGMNKTNGDDQQCLVVTVLVNLKGRRSLFGSDNYDSKKSSFHNRVIRNA